MTKTRRGATAALVAALVVMEVGRLGAQDEPSIRRSKNAFFRAPLTHGCGPPRSRNSGFSSCSLNRL